MRGAQGRCPLRPEPRRRPSVACAAVIGAALPVDFPPNASGDACFPMIPDIVVERHGLAACALGLGAWAVMGRLGLDTVVGVEIHSC